MNTSLQILLCIAVIILIAKLAGALTARLGLPLVLGELLAGVFLGPTVFNIWSLSWLAQPATTDSVSVVAVFKVLAEIGVVLLMFVAGLETDVAMMRSAVAPAFWAASGGVILPMLGGTAHAREFGFSWQEAIFIGTILTATSVTITAQTLMNLNCFPAGVSSRVAWRDGCDYGCVPGRAFRGAHLRSRKSVSGIAAHDQLLLRSNLLCFDRTRSERPAPGGRDPVFSILLLIAIVGKIAGCGLGALFSGFSRRESLVVGVGMIPRGEVGLITASLGLAAGLVSRDLYAQVVVLVLLTTLLTPPLLRFVFPQNVPKEAGSETALSRTHEFSEPATNLIDA